MHEKMQKKLHSIHVFKEIVAFTRYSMTLALTPLKTTSKQQYLQAVNVRMEALTGIWENHSKEKNQRVAEALIAAANTHTDASWWLDRSRCTPEEFMYELPINPASF